MLVHYVAFLLVTAAFACQDIGNQKVFNDPTCSQAGADHTGCNAGGQGINCRFCTAAPVACAAAGSTTAPTTTTTTPQVTLNYTTTEGPSTPVPTPPGNQTLIWSDEFDTLDFANWKHELTMSGGGNWEFEWYVNNRSNSFVKDGVLNIRPTLTEDAQDIKGSVDFWGGQPADQCTMNQFFGCSRDYKASGNVINPIRSARLRTAETFGFRYGRVEIRAKMPKGDWLWPAIWMLPTKQEYGVWPSSGEIDICESRGNAPSYAPGGRNQIASTLHFGPDYAHDPYEKAHSVYNLPSGDFSDDFHVFGLVWTETGIKTYVDSESNVLLNIDCQDDSFWKLGDFPSSMENPWQYSKSLCAPFDKEFYLILNLAVGGTGGYFPEGVGGKPWSNTDTHSVNQFWDAKSQWYSTWDKDNSSLKVDYIRVWQ